MGTVRQLISAMAVGALLAGAGAVPALAQAASGKGPAAAAPARDPQKEALVRRYLAAIDFERNMDAMQAAMLPVMSERLAQSGTELTEDDRKAMVEIVRRVMHDQMMPQMIERMVPIYAAAFSTDELQAMVAFYESPVGHAITAKIPTLAPKGAEISRELMPAMMAEVLKQMLEHFCPGGTCPAKAPKARTS